MSAMETHQRTAIDVVIVSYNCREALLKCLDRLNECRERFDLTVRVVDNASSDGTAPAVKGSFPDVEVVENEHNVGFAAGCNIGILQGHEDWVLLLNPDCQITAQALTHLVDCHSQDWRAAFTAPFLTDHREIVRPIYRGVVTLREFTAKMLFIDRLLKPKRRCASVGTSARTSGPTGGYEQNQIVDYVEGACVLCRRSALNAVGLLDPGFFLYFEDQDLCVRAREKGFDVISCPNALVEHAQGTSAKRSPERSIFESYRSVCYFFDRHRGRGSRLALRLSVAIGVLLRLLAFGVACLSRSRRSEARSRAAAYRRVVSELVFSTTGDE